MHLLGFGISFAFLTLACIFGIIAIVTTAWWKDDEGNFTAGVWQQCYADTPCVDYGTVFDRSVKKLLNASFDETRERLANEEHHLNIVRGMAIFDLIALGVATFIISLFIYSIKTQTAKSIAIWLQAVVAAIILTAGLVGLASAMHATNYKRIFGYHLEGMKLGGSWVLFLICNIIALLTGCVLVATLCYHCIKSKRTEKEKGGTKATNSKPSSRKGSQDVEVVANFTAHHHHPYTQYYPDQKDKDETVDDADYKVDENDNDYKIPELCEVMSNYEDLNDDEHSLNGLGINRSCTESDYTLAQLSDYSSQPMSDLNSDFTLANHNRSASFSNQLYDDVN